MPVVGIGGVCRRQQALAMLLTVSATPGDSHDWVLLALSW